MEKKIKKKLTLSGSSKRTHNVSNYTKIGGKTSVVIEKKAPRRWGERKFQSRNNNLNKPKPDTNFIPKKKQINKNFDIRKMAEERATKRFKNLKEESLQQKKSTLKKYNPSIRTSVFRSSLYLPKGFIFPSITKIFLFCGKRKRHLAFIRNLKL